MSKAHYYAIGRKRHLGMNKTEEAYAQLLELKKRAGSIVEYRYEPIKLRLADKTFYSPDFMVQNSTLEIEFHEVKGFWEDDARVKIKVAAATFPLFRFVAIQFKKGAWVYEEF